MKKKSNRILKIIRIIFLIAGIKFVLLCLIATSTLPFWAYYRLGTSNSKIEQAPNTIVLLSGLGMPSEDVLLRSYYTARLSKKYPEAKIIISIPGDLTDSTSTPITTTREMILRGIEKSKILYETEGKNTRGQALMLATGILKNELNNPITIVTAPEHMTRAVKSFRKCGFTQVSGLPIFENALESDLTYDDKNLKGNKMAPSIGNNMQLRYQFWSHLKLEVIVLREYFALSYYKLRGWI